MSINIKTALHNAQTYQELLAISNEMHAGLSWWGYQYAYAPTSLSVDKEVIYTGRITIGAIAEKAVKIRQEMEKIKKDSLQMKQIVFTRFLEKFIVYMPR